MLSTVIEWFKNPESLLVAMGPWVLWGTMLIVLIESGVLFPVLPGESLLFNTLGSVIWGAGFILVGALLGNVPFVHDNLTLILAVIIEMVGKRRAGADK